MPEPVHAPPAVGVGRRDERVGAVVDVEQRRLAALEQHGLAARRAPARAAARCRRPSGRSRSAYASSSSTTSSTSTRAAVVDLDEQLVLDARARASTFCAQDLLVEQVLHPDADAGHLVGVRRADAAAGRADLGACRGSARSPCRWSRLYGVIRCAFALTTRAARCRRRAPRARRSRSNSTPRSTTTPLPITGVHAGREDARRAAGAARTSRRPMTTVWPALLPPLVAHDVVDRGRRAGRSPCPCPRRPTGRRSETIAGMWCSSAVDVRACARPPAADRPPRAPGEVPQEFTGRRDRS